MPAKKKKAKKKIEKDKTAEQPQVDMALAAKFLISMSAIVNNSLRHYWLSSSDAAEYTTECFRMLTGLFKTCDRIVLRIINGILMINGNPVEDKSAVLRMLVGHLSDLEIDNFNLISDLSEEDFSKFLEIISAQPAEIKQLGEFTSLLEQFGVKNIETKRMIYREVMEEEMVVSRDDFEKAGKGDGPGETDAGNILAFLKGDVSVTDENMAQKVQETASDPARMAELILRAADIRQEAADVEGGEGLVDFVVGCLRRTCNGMSQASSFKTQKGKKKITRDLVLLEEEVLNRMREMSSEWDDEDLSAITAVTEEMTDEIKMDAAVDEYVTKLSASQASEQNILNFVKSEKGAVEGESKLQQKLADRGLSMAGWQELVVKSGGGEGGAGLGPGAGPGPGGGGFGSGHIIEAIAHLDTLLNSMEKEFTRSDKPALDSNAQKLLDVLKDVSKEVKSLALGTDRKIQSLIEGLRADDETIRATEEAARTAGKEIMLTRKQVLSIIAGITKEIAEPLDLIKTSLDMINSKALGGNADLQSTAISLAEENAQIIKKLLDRLNRISG